MIVTLNFPVPFELRQKYAALAKTRKVPVGNLYAAVLAEALELELAATVPCAGRKPRAKETKPRAPRRMRVAPAELTVTPSSPAC